MVRMLFVYILLVKMATKSKNFEMFGAEWGDAYHNEGGYFTSSYLNNVYQGTCF